MKKLIALVLLFASNGLSAQADEKAAVKKTIDDFFVGFHAQDSVQIKSTVAEGIIMQRISQKEDGTAEHRTDDFKKFLKGIISIPKDKKFKEKLTSYSIQIDGPMANAWTGYEFYVNDKMHHCGVNSFQLFNDGNGWKIIYLVDNGRTGGCE